MYPARRFFAHRYSAHFVAAVMLLAGCGFQPVHGRYAAGTSALADRGIDVAPIPNREGQLLHNALLDRLAPRGGFADKRYTLNISLVEQINNLAVRRDAVATRANLTMTARYALHDRETGRELLAGNIRTVMSYNIANASFQTIVAERDARERGAIDLADEITARLAVFFAHESVLSPQG